MNFSKSHTSTGLFWVMALCVFLIGLSTLGVTYGYMDYADVHQIVGEGPKLVSSWAIPEGALLIGSYFLLPTSLFFLFGDKYSPVVQLICIFLGFLLGLVVLPIGLGLLSNSYIYAAQEGISVSLLKSSLSAEVLDWVRLLCSAGLVFCGTVQFGKWSGVFCAMAQKDNTQGKGLLQQVGKIPLLQKFFTWYDGGKGRNLSQKPNRGRLLVMVGLSGYSVGVVFGTQSQLSTFLEREQLSYHQVLGHPFWEMIYWIGLFSVGITLALAVGYLFGHKFAKPVEYGMGISLFLCSCITFVTVSAVVIQIQGMSALGMASFVAYDNPWANANHWIGMGILCFISSIELGEMGKR